MEYSVISFSFLLCVKWEEETDEVDNELIGANGNETDVIREDNEVGSHVRKSLSYASSALTICFVIEVTEFRGISWRLFRRNVYSQQNFR